MLALHPQPCPGRPRNVRWITPLDVLPFTGPVALAPPPLAALLDDATLTGVHLETAAVVTVLHHTRHWRTEGPRVRTALHAAVAMPERWHPERTPGGHGSGCPPTDGDDVLREAARALIAGTAGQVARSHGGRLHLVDVAAGVVTVRLGGACHGCPAATLTLQSRLETQLRERFPHFVAVTATTGSRT